MPAPKFPIKVCPFCLVDAHTDAASCSYCGCSYDHVAPAAAPRRDAHTRLRTYNGTPVHDEAARVVSVEIP